MLSNDQFIREPRWYVVQTKPHEEERADYNLQAWKVETFAPKLKARRLNEFSQRSTVISKPLFPGYIFARFNASTSLHNINATRGVQCVVRFGDVLVPVEDEVIDMIRSRTQAGFVEVGEEISPGRKFTICDGPLNGLTGVLERKMKDKERVMLLLQSVSYQGHFMIDSDRLKLAS